ncbi:MAG: flagellar export protein FliJ [Desulfovibrio sp.]|jgi:flagellar FliJ protein|nr:flagellar export protein FliJ [Desulfovibrio sp.]
MAAFSFRLEQIRLYRRHLEEQAMRALAGAVTRRDATLARIDDLREAIEEQLAMLCRAEKLSAAERWLSRTYEACLKRDLEQSLELLAEQEHDVDQCRVALIQKAQDRDLLDTLKEKQSARFALEERKKEQQINDETATLRYTPAAL